MNQRESSGFSDSLQFGTGVPEETAEGQNFQGHAGTPEFVLWVIQFVRQVSFNPGKGLALGAGLGILKGTGDRAQLMTRKIRLRRDEQAR